ncbi:MAG: glycosyltransferase family 2 protein [Burkholderiales bacterium]
MPRFPDSDIAVIVPTNADPRRAELLRAAVGSVLTQDGAGAELVVVINGGTADAELVAWLNRQEGVRVIRRAEPNVSLARHAGLMATLSPYYCFLDDDDELLPNALKLRCDALAGHPEADVLVSDGLVRYPEGELPNFRDGMAAKIRRDPGLSFLERNWFDSPAATFRRSRIGPEYFSTNRRHYEWSHLLLRLISDTRCIEILDQLTYLKREDNPLSVSRSDEHLLQLPHFLIEALNLPLPPALRAGLQHKLVRAWNACAVHQLGAGQRREAVKAHWQCLRAGGWSYLGFTRHLLWRVARSHTGSSPRQEK